MMTYISSNTKTTETTLPIALALYLQRSDVEKHPCDEIGTWRFISGTDKRHPPVFATCTFTDALCAFLLGEISDYYGDWVSETLEQVANCNNGKVVKVVETEVKKRAALTVISLPELDILIANGFTPIGYTPDMK